MTTRSPARLLSIFAILLTALSACTRDAPPAFDPTPFETPAAAAVLRHLLAETKAAGVDARVGVIVLGDRLHDGTARFREQFADTGIAWHPGSEMTQVWVGPVARVIEKSSKLQPLQLQVASVTKRDPANPASAEEVVAAWGFEDRMVRRRFLATPGHGAEWVIQTLETLEQKPQVVP